MQDEYVCQRGGKLFQRPGETPSARLNFWERPGFRGAFDLTKAAYRGWRSAL
jgi:hypothetical protein